MTRAKPMSDKQRDMLKSFARDNEATDLADFYYGRDSTLAWRNRELVITALWNRGYLNEDGITEAGRAALADQKETT